MQELVRDAFGAWRDFVYDSKESRVAAEASAVFFTKVVKSRLRATFCAWRSVSRRANNLKRVCSAKF